MSYISNDGIKIYYEIEGEGPPVVMIISFSGSIATSICNKAKMCIV